jgi:hypothetical protein
VVTEQIGPGLLARPRNTGPGCLLDRRRSGYDRIARAIAAAATVSAPRADQATNTQSREE